MIKGFGIKLEERYLISPDMAKFKDASSEDFKKCSEACSKLANVVTTIRAYAADLNTHARIAQGAFQMCETLEEDIRPYNLTQLENIIRNLLFYVSNINECTQQIKETINSITGVEAESTDEAFKNNFKKIPDAFMDEVKKDEV